MSFVNLLANGMFTVLCSTVTQEEQEYRKKLECEAISEPARLTGISKSECLMSWSMMVTVSGLDDAVVTEAQVQRLGCFLYSELRPRGKPISVGTLAMPSFPHTSCEISLSQSFRVLWHISHMSSSLCLSRKGGVNDLRCHMGIMLCCFSFLNQFPLVRLC